MQNEFDTPNLDYPVTRPGPASAPRRRCHERAGSGELIRDGWRCSPSVDLDGARSMRTPDQLAHHPAVPFSAGAPVRSGRTLAPRRRAGEAARGGRLSVGGPIEKRDRIFFTSGQIIRSGPQAARGAARGADAEQGKSGMAEGERNWNWGTDDGGG